MQAVEYVEEDKKPSGFAYEVELGLLCELERVSVA